ncbi:MAG: patatin-like phospholipase family protein [Rhodothermales bacterium]
MIKHFIACFALLHLSGCASYGVIDNDELSGTASTQSYSVKAQGERRESGDIALTLAFSGGGTRAAALAYGVMQELRDTAVKIDGRKRRLLDEVDTISSVSGGSFTSAYYGLYGDRIFEDYEKVFLRRNIESGLIRGVLNPLNWFKSTGRTEMAINYYEKQVFHGATFADMQRQGGPLILINASDLGYGVRFSFVQEYFNLLCSDISTYPVARAVTASSAVPVLFNPVVLENHQGCKHLKPGWLLAAKKHAKDDPQLAQIVEGLESYFLDDRQYAHLVDGGITDNLGLRAPYEVIKVSGGAKTFMKKSGRKIPRHAVLISVDASTSPEPEMDRSSKQPSLMETINAMSNIQLHRYNTDTLDLMDKSLMRWARELSNSDKRVKPSFVQIGIKDVRQPEEFHFLNGIPTSFSISDEQVDRLIQAGRKLLRSNPDYQRFLAGIGGPVT